MSLTCLPSYRLYHNEGWGLKKEFLVFKEVMGFGDSWYSSLSKTDFKKIFRSEEEKNIWISSTIGSGFLLTIFQI